MRGNRRAAALILAIVLFPACSSGLFESSPPANEAAPAAQLRQDARRPPVSRVARMVRRVLPSVVNVRVTSVTLDTFGPRASSGQGSGVIIDRNGTIVTNAHVVQGAVRVTVVLNDDEGTTLEGDVVGLDPDRDLAVIDVDAEGLRPIELGRSNAASLSLGDSVVAIGFPLGLGGPTVTKGIVSGQNRNINVSGVGGSSTRLTGMLQTDAAINPGNSGGALVNSAGQLVGINSAGAQAGAAENIGFAIAIDSALPVVEEILSKPQEERAWLGVYLIDVNPLIAGQLGLPRDTNGVLVESLVPDGPAADAGVREGDVIVRAGDEEIGSSDDLTTALTALSPGDEVELELVSRDGRRNVTVDVAKRPVSLQG
jgi:S1-C subfamily serine protease